MSEENKRVVRQFLDTLNRQDLQALDEVVAGNVAWHCGSLGEIQGLDGFKQLFSTFVTALPGMTVEPHVMVSEGDLVAARLTTSGTHGGELLGVPATGKRVSMGEQFVYRISSGKIAEAWWVGDVFGLMQQMNATAS